MPRRVHNQAAAKAAVPPTPDMRMRSYPEELTFRVRRFMRGDRIYLLFLLLAMVLARSTDQVLYYRMADKYANYIWYLSTVVLPVAYICLTWPVVFYKIYVSKTITPEMRKWRYHAVYMVGAACDTIFNLTSSWPVPYLSGPIVNTLSNAVLPFTMVASIIFLKTRYKFTHFVGAALVLYGIMVQLLPQVFLGENANEGKHEEKQGVWIVVLVLSALPAAFSNIVKEGGLKGADLDEWHLNAAVSGYQFLFGLLTAPTVAIPFPKPAAVINLTDLPQYCSRANQCFFGHDSQPGDDCHGMFFIFAIFILFNITYNQLSLMIFKRGSSVLFTIASAMRLPVVDLLLLSSFIAGPASVDKLSVYTYYAVFGIVLGIVTYYHEKEVHAVAPGAGVPGLDDDGTGGGYIESDRPFLHSPHGGQGMLHHVPPPDLDHDDDMGAAPLLGGDHLGELEGGDAASYYQH